MLIPNKAPIPHKPSLHVMVDHHLVSRPFSPLRSMAITPRVAGGCSESELSINIVHR